MVGDRFGALTHDFHRLFSEGTLAGLSDGELVERFITRRDEEAFAALIDRHGAMILNTCRSLLKNRDELEDAYQAVLLVFVNRARSLWVKDSLCGWLHEVACRVALQANADAARRRIHERKAAEMRNTRPTNDRGDSDGQIHDEVRRLPENLRLPVVLCYFEGFTYQEAAKHLRWSEGEIRGRLARAREVLRPRLIRRGITFSTGMLGLGLPHRATASPAFDPVHRAVPWIRRGNAGQTFAASGSPARWARRVLQGMRWAKLKLLAATALVLAMTGGVMALLAGGSSDAVAQTPESQAKPISEVSKPAGDRKEGQLGLVAPQNVYVTPGRGSILVYALDASGSRSLEKTKPTSPHYREEYQERQWMTVTGILDHRLIRENLAKAQGVNLAQAHPRYLRGELERQDREPGKGWSQWAKVDRRASLLVLKNVPEVYEEVLPEKVRLEPLVDPLPYFRNGFYGGIDPAQLMRELPPVGAPPDQVNRDYPTTEAPQVLVRNLDYTVDAGKIYRYRVRVVVGELDRKGEVQEVSGPWSIPTNEACLPAL